MSAKNTDETVRSLSVTGKLSNAPLICTTPDELEKMSAFKQIQRTRTLNKFFATELQRQTDKLIEKEQTFITQQLEQHPVEIARRTNSTSNSGLEGMTTTSAQAEPIDMATALLRQQRAACCRKSRINIKIKKAALRHRNTFIAEEVATTQKTLASLMEKLQVAEQNLLRSGFNGAQLAKLRHMYGVSHLPID